MSTKKTTIGGQAIIEGIVMKGPKKTCTVVRKPGGELVTKTEPAHHQPAFWRLPILRGAYTLFTAMKDGIVAINYSAEFFDDESIDEEPSKFEKWLEAKFGSEKLNNYINNNPSVELHPINYVNNPSVIAQNDNMVSINSCLQIDLLGQVVSDTVGLNQYSAVGGQVDFVRGATMSKGGRSIIAMPSTAKKGLISRIVPLITEGSAVTTPRNDVNYVVTEYGIAQLKGKTLKERAKALIRIAHPKFRPHLILEYKKRYNEEPFTSEEMQTQFKDYLSETKESIKDGVASLISKIKE